MPFCVAPGCPTIVVRGRCAAHAVERERSRPNHDWRKWYHTKRWERLRIQVITEALNQCAACKAVTLRIEVDHIRRHDGNAQLFWDRNNLQALCVACHTTKTMRGE